MINLIKHQQEAVDFLVEKKGNAGIFYGCGTGKTILTIDYVMRHTTSQKALVVCPLTLIENAWNADAQKYGDVVTESLRDPMGKDANFYLINYESVIRPGKLEALKKYGPDCTLIIDESSRMKNPTSQTTKALIKLASFFDRRILLSGSPAPNSEAEFFSQMRMLSDSIFGPDFYTFRDHFFVLERGGSSVQCGRYINPEMLKKGWKLKLNDKMRERLVSRMVPWVIFKELKDCVSLPPQSDIVRNFTLLPEEQEIYNQMRDDLVAEINDDTTITADMAMTKINKLRQITSGFIINTEDGHTFNAGKSSKVEALKELLAEIGNNQVIIWTCFLREAQNIHALYPSDSLVINGSINEGDKQFAINEFKAGRVKYLIANPLSVAHGLTLTNCSYAVYFSLSFSWEQLVQSRARIHRITQTSPCVYYYLLSRGTVEEIIYKTLQYKGTLEDVVRQLVKQGGNNVDKQFRAVGV